ncbi:LysR substrate-binding domain-containing protein [Pseudomonadota bacterium]
MNIRDLRYLVAVADLKHFGQAASFCHVSQPTLSGQIKKLEDSLGIKLFERNNRSVVLTDICLDILVFARRILREVDQINEVAENAHDPKTGKFRLGAFPTLATYLFPELVKKVKASMPDLHLVLIEEKTEQLMEKLRHAEVDAAFLALPVADDSLYCKKLFEDEFYLAVPPEHALASCKTVAQDSLEQYRVLLLEEGHCLRDQALDVCQKHGVGEELDYRATSLETLRQMVKGGTGITFMPKIAIQPNEEGICYIQFAQPAPSRSIAMVWRKTSSRQKVAELLCAMFDEAGLQVNRAKE